jgi:hypothetical protein
MWISECTDNFRVKKINLLRKKSLPAVLLDARIEAVQGKGNCNAFAGQRFAGKKN